MTQASPGYGRRHGGYQKVRTIVKHHPYPVVKHVPYEVIKPVPVYQPVYNTVYKKVPQPYEVVRHVPVVKHVEVVKHVPVVKKVEVVKHYPVVKHHYREEKVPVKVPVYVDKPKYGHGSSHGGYGGHH